MSPLNPKLENPGIIKEHCTKPTVDKNEQFHQLGENYGLDVQKCQTMMIDTGRKVWIKSPV